MKKQNLNKKRPWIEHYVPPCEKDIPKIKDCSLVNLLNSKVSAFKSKTAFIQGMPNGMKASLTYQEIWDLSDEFALYLREVLKLKGRDRIGVQLPNCLVYPIVALGIWKAGCILVNINPLSTAQEMVEKFKKAPLKTLVLLNMFVPQYEEASKQVSIANLCLVDITMFFKFPERTVLQLVLKFIKKATPKYTGKATSYDAIHSQIRPWLDKKTLLLKQYLQKVTPKDIAVLQYTGGTSGINKAAMLTHENLIANVMQIHQYAKGNLNEGKEIVLTVLPLYHIFAFTVNFLLFFYNGAMNVLIPSPRPLTNLKKVMHAYPITWLTGVNTLFKALLESRWFSKKSLPQLKTSVAGGMALQSNVAQQWKQQFPSEIVEGYGLTEASPVVTFNPIGGDVKSGTIGIPLPSTEVKCVDERGKTVPIGQTGELLVKGPQVMEGYWQSPEETRTTLQSGWLYTGDMAQMDAQGYFKIVDRKKGYDPCQRL